MKIYLDNYLRSKLYIYCLFSLLSSSTAFHSDRLNKALNSTSDGKGFCDFIIIFIDSAFNLQAPFTNTINYS